MTLLIPPPLVQALECFDGVQSALDLRAELVRITGEIQVGEIEKQLFDSLDDAGFLENERYRSLKAKRETEFAAEAEREAIFAGSAYPSDGVKLRDLLAARIGEAQGDASITAVAAPHASPEGAWNTYRAAYRCLPSQADAAGRTFVILGTSHYGAPDRFGLTRKPFVTALGTARTNTALVDELAQKAPSSTKMEDYCHAVEHSIEFQVIFLQHIYGSEVSILPILCGPFIQSIYEGIMPEESGSNATFFDALGNLAAREGKRLFWVLGIDMAHIGRRYGDPVLAQANDGEMLVVEQRDRQRITCVENGDVNSYWSLVQENHDDLKWCGASPLYTFLKVMPDLRGKLLDYRQWQIDPHSVVSFGALRFEPS
jgi:AmmeMemoRadiSam system protein B